MLRFHIVRYHCISLHYYLSIHYYILTRTIYKFNGNSFNKNHSKNFHWASNTYSFKFSYLVANLLATLVTSKKKKKSNCFRTNFPFLSTEHKSFWNWPLQFYPLIVLFWRNRDYTFFPQHNFILIQLWRCIDYLTCETFSEIFIGLLSTNVEVLGHGNQPT